MKNIVAVVVTYNRKELLVECIKAILGQTVKLKNIIIIDNNSTDGTQDYLKEKKLFDKKEIIYRKLEKNIGGAGGFHEGIKDAIKQDIDFAWIMDDDTIPTENCLEKMIKANEFLESKGEKISFLSSSIYGQNGEFMNVPEIDNTPTDNGYPDWYRYLDEKIVEIKIATFVSILITKKCIEKCGLPCKDFFIWGDDIEYTTRITKYYGPAFMIGDSIAIHKRKNARSLSIFTEENPNRIKMYYYSVRNSLIYTKEYQSKLSLIKVIITNYVNIIKLLFKPKIKYRLKKIKNIFLGVNSFIFRHYDYKAFKNRLKTKE